MANLSLPAQDTINQLDDQGRKTGYWKIYGYMKSFKKGYDSTAVIEKGNYKFNRKTGWWIGYYPEGMKKHRIHYKNGRPHGGYTSYYKSGCIEETGKWPYNSNDTLRTYFDDCSSSDDTGQVNRVTVPKGRSYDYYPSPKPRMTYDAAHPNSDTIKYYPSKTAQYKHLKRDSVNGYWKSFTVNQDVNQDGEFRNGKLYNGRHYIYDEHGLLDRINVYSEGKLVGKGIIE